MSRYLGQRGLQNRVVVQQSMAGCGCGPVAGLGRNSGLSGSSGVAFPIVGVVGLIAITLYLAKDSLKS